MCIRDRTDGAFTKGDWCKLTVYGVKGNEVTGHVDFYLADYRFFERWLLHDCFLLFLFRRACRCYEAVSYTHLDVYKRQGYCFIIAKQK